MVYKWSIGMFSKVDANDVGKEFEKIEKKNGEVTKSAIVDAARNKNNVMHDLFEWDDAIAGEKYRLSQAGTIMAALIVEKEQNMNYGGRAYVNIERSEEIGTKGRYVNYESAMSDDEMRSVILRNALKELVSFKEKYKELKELEKVFAAIDFTQEEFKFE